MQVGASALMADEAMTCAEMDTSDYLKVHGTVILMGHEPRSPATIALPMKPRLIFRPTILDRYVLREVASPFLIGLVLFTFVLLIPHLADISDLLVGKSASWTVIGKLVFNILPSFLALTIPMAFLLAVLLGLGRLASESELVAMQAVGVSPLFLLRALTVLGVLASGATYYVHAFWVPDANQAYRETAFSLAISRAQSVKPRVFIEDLLPHRSIYLSDVETGTGVWKDALIIDRQDAGRPRIWLARRGQLSINRAEKRVELALESGSAYSFDMVERKTYDFQRFKSGRFPIDFGQIFPDLPLSRGDREMTPAMLLKEIARFEKAGNVAEAARYSVEYHKKYALSVVPLVFAILGLALMLGGRRDSRQSAFGLAIAVIFVYYILARLGEQAGDTRALPPGLAVWAANVILGGLAIALLRRARREGTVDPFRVADLVARAFRAVTPRARATVRHTSSIGARAVGVLDRYIGREYLRMLALASVALLILPVLLEFMDLLDDVQQNHVKGATLISYFGYNLPFYLFSQILPMAVLIATLATYGIMARQNEITAMKATGISVYRAAVPGFVIASIAAVLMFAGNDAMVPPYRRLAQREHDVIKGRPPRSNSALDRRMALGSDGRFYSYNQIAPSTDPGSVVFRGLSVLDIDPKTWTLREHLMAEDVRWDGRVYELSRGFRRTFKGDATADRVIDTVRSAEIDPPTYFKKEERTAEELSFNELEGHIESLEGLGLDATSLRVGLHRKVSYPAMCLVMAFVGLPFSMFVGKRGALFGVGIALFLAAFYQVGFVFSEALGRYGYLPPMLAAWAPNIVFVGLGAILVLSLDT
jgi:LPS export ABC transporter permease LptG/LPS export ABC transporter permease LptF